MELIVLIILSNGRSEQIISNTNLLPYYFLIMPKRKNSSFFIPPTLYKVAFKPVQSDFISPIRWLFNTTGLIFCISSHLKSLDKLLPSLTG